MTTLTAGRHSGLRGTPFASAQHGGTTTHLPSAQGRIYSQQGPVQKKCGALQLGRQTLFFLKKWRPFLSSPVSVVISPSSKTGDLFLLMLTRGSPIFLACKKITAPFVGPLFVGAPVWPNKLNMPKSIRRCICDRTTTLLMSWRHCTGCASQNACSTQSRC